jgi:hypothetical protein
MSDKVSKESLVDSFRSICDSIGLKDTLKTIREAQTQVTKEWFNARFKEFFEEYPGVYSVSWQQYTPYFCDGDACEFSSGHMYCEINEIEPSYDGVYPVDDNLKVACKVAGKILSEFNDDDMLALFGDHVQVNVTPSGVDVSEYDHE